MSKGGYEKFARAWHMLKVTRQRCNVCPKLFRCVKELLKFNYNLLPTGLYYSSWIISRGRRFVVQ